MVLDRVIGRPRTIAAAVAIAGVGLSMPARAQGEAVAAIAFLRSGGAYCFRVAPEGVAMSEETAWTVMLLTSGSNRNNDFRIRTVDPGPTGLRGRELQGMGETVNGVWRQDSLREEFFERFSAGIGDRTLRARVVKIEPPDLARLKPAERADLYLRFTDRGTRVSFGKVPDLTAEEFRKFAEYYPD
jgi:hypothetical protein